MNVQENENQASAETQPEQAPRPPRGWRSSQAARVLIVAVLSGLGIGFALMPRPAPLTDEKQPPPAVEFLGHRLALDAQAPKTALELSRRYLAGKLTLKLPDGEQKSFTFHSLGAKLDKVRLSRLVRDAKDPTSPMRRHWAENASEKPLKLPVPIILDPEKALSQLLLLKDKLDRLPVMARLDLQNKKVIEEVVGRKLDVDASIFALSKAAQSGQPQAVAAFKRRQPARVKADLKDIKFDKVLGFFETRYDRSEKYQARTYNLRLAASKLDGHVLMPGEQFDFNAVVGPRDEASGYKVAKVIAEGELVDGIGGGTCQISGTLHGAAFFAGLAIVERYPHTRPSSYIKMGLDATVVYPTINFQLKNNFDFPVVLHQTVKDGVVRAEILGAKHETTVTLIRRILAAVPYEELERPNEDLPAGVRVLSQRGVPGFKLRRYRLLRDGRHVVRERWDDVYPPTAQIVYVGTGDAGLKTERRGDSTPEYMADELLVMTAGPDIRSDGEKTILEKREAGRYGSPGWTREADMPFFSDKNDS